MVYSHWLGLEPGPEQGPGRYYAEPSHCTGTWKNGLYGFNENLFDTAPEQGQGRTLVFITGHIFRT